MNKIMKMFNTAIFVLTITLAGITHADNVEIKLGSGDGFKVQDSNSSPLMDILSGGNVGIGIVNPSEKLEVSGNIKAIKFMGDGSGLTGIISSAWTTNGSDIYYNSGNVGIGTTSPGTRFEVLTSNDNSVLSISITGDDDTNILANAYRIVGETIWLAGVDTSDSNKYKISIGGSLTSFTGPKITIATDGNVGIGTTSPGYELEVNGQISASQGYKHKDCYWTGWVCADNGGCSDGYFVQNIKVGSSVVCDGNTTQDFQLRCCR